MRKMIAGLMALGVTLTGASLALAEGGSSAQTKPSAVSGISKSNPASHKAASRKTAMGTKSAKAQKHPTASQAAPKSTADGK